MWGIMESHMRVVAIANAKGGVGKTTIAVHLAVALSRDGYRVLCVDLDPQANATQWMSPALPSAQQGIADALIAETPLTTDFLVESDLAPGLVIAPSTRRMARLDHALASASGGQMMLNEALANLAGQFDFVLIDCPPNLGLPVLGALCAAQHVLVPVQAAYLSLAGLGRLNEVVANTRKRLRVPTSILGYVLFASDNREAITSEVRGLLQAEYDDLLFRSAVRVSTNAKALPASRVTAFTRGADPRGRADYELLAEEFLAKLSVKSVGERRAG
jgi:chromosome partitioning protein